MTSEIPNLAPTNPNPATTEVQPYPFPPGPAAESTDFLYQLEAERSAQGDAFDVSLGGLRCVIVSHPHDIRRVFTDANFREKGPLYDGVRQIIGDGILTSGGQKWRDHHRLIVPTFHRNHVADMVDTIAEVGSAYVGDLKTRAEDGVVIDVQEEMTKLTLDTLTAVLFGRHATATQELSYEDLRATFSLAGGLTKETDQETKERAANIATQLRTVAQTLIHSAREEEPDSTLLSTLAHTKDEIAGSYLDDEVIRDELMTLMFAGHETTALTLTWLLELTKNRPDILERMRQEVQDVLGDEKPSITTLSNLTYTRQVIDEVLRLRPPVPLTARSVAAEGTIGGVAVHPHELVLPFIWGAHRHQDFWNEPARFDPDRFSAKNSAGRDKWSYIPFAAGARICVGKSLALTELSIHTALLLRDVDLQIVSDQVTPKASMTLRPSHPVQAQVKPY